MLFKETFLYIIFRIILGIDLILPLHKGMPWSKGTFKVEQCFKGEQVCGGKNKEH